MNYLDIGIFLILLLFLIVGRNRGFIKTCISFIPTLGGLFLTNEIYPLVSKFMRTTFIYENLKEGVTKMLSLDNFEAFLEKSITDSQAINALKLPSFFKTALVENNNSVVYNVLGAENFSDYVASYIANACLNVLCMVVVLIITVLIIRLVLNALDLVAKLPVLNFLNKTLGGFAGLIQGLIVVWIVGIVLVFFYSKPSFKDFFDLLEQSKFALFLYENNLLLFMILRIMA